MDYYNTLGVSRTASQEEIKKAFRKLAMQHHPDQGGDVNKFQEITAAYETLSDPIKREEYDNPRPTNSHHSMNGGFPGGFNFNFNGIDLSSIFGQHFRDSFAQQFSGGFNQQTKPTYRTRVSISLVDAYNGTEQVMQLSTPTGVKVINIKIPAGIDNNMNIRYDNLIDDCSLIVEFSILPDLRFTREGPDLYSNLPINVLDLIVGKTIEFKTINGNVLNVTIPPYTQPNQQIKISGHGMPIGNGTRGDQILLLKPHIPANINSEIIEAIKKHQLV